MSYLTLAVPVDKASIARSVALAFEPDSGVSPTTYDTFSMIAVDSEGNEYGVYGSPVVDSLTESATVWQYAPEALQEAVAGSLASKYPEYPVPTLEAIQSFLEGLKMSFVYGTAAGIAEMGLTIDV